MEYDPEDSLFSDELQAYEKYFDAEPNFMAVEGYVDNNDKAKLRKNAIQIISRLLHSMPKKFDAFIPYLAMNYFDRFLSRREIPTMQGSRRDDLKLFVLCCLTLAWKMMKKSFSITKFLMDRFLIRLLMKMEFHILDELEWRMNALTPSCFVEYFVPYFKLRDPPITGRFKRGNIDEIIIQTQGDITFTKFKPSIIAASALLIASSVLYPRSFLQFRDKISSARVIKKEALLECLEAMDKLCKEKKIAIERPETESNAALSLTAGSSEPLELAGGDEEVPSDVVTSNHTRSDRGPLKRPKRDLQKPRYLSDYYYY